MEDWPEGWFCSATSGASVHQRSSVVETHRLPAVNTRSPDGFHFPIDFLEACPVETATLLICLKRCSCSEAVGRLCGTLARVRPALTEVSTDLALAIYH